MTPAAPVVAEFSPVLRLEIVASARRAIQRAVAVARDAAAAAPHSSDVVAAITLLVGLIGPFRASRPSSGNDVVPITMTRAQWLLVERAVVDVIAVLRSVALPDRRRQAIAVERLTVFQRSLALARAQSHGVYRVRVFGGEAIREVSDE
jgi:hypothetical protein